MSATMMSTSRGAVHLAAGEGDALHMSGDTYLFKAVGANTEGAFILFEAFVPPQGGPPLHIHHREGEHFYLLEGELEFVANERTFTARAGSFVHIPQGTPHRFKNVGTEPAKTLIMFSPAGLEGLFFAVGRPATPGSAPSPPDAEEIAKLLAVGPEYGLEVVPPA